MKNLIYIFIFMAGVFIAVKIAPDMVMNYSGYCAREGRYLTDQEKIDAVVKKFIDQPKRNNNSESRTIFSMTTSDFKINPEGGIEILGTTKEVSFLKASYSSIKDFYNQNPNCCRLTETMPGEGKPLSLPLSWRINGKLNTFVLVSFLDSYDEQNGMKPLYSFSYIPISNCGDYVDTRFFMTE